MTKEAKLSAAMRILPEWKGYDDEIRKLQQKIDFGVLDSDPAEEMVDVKGKFVHVYEVSEATFEFCIFLSCR